MLQAFAGPSRYAQGPGATASLGSEMRGLDLEGPVLIVAGASTRRRRSRPVRSSSANWKHSKKPSPKDWLRIDAGGQKQPTATLAQVHLRRIISSRYR